MTKQKWLAALLVGSSIGCLCDTHLSSAQSLSDLKYRLQRQVCSALGVTNDRRNQS
jgi:hypothetical protein